MVVRDLDFPGIFVSPFEANAVLTVDPDRGKSGSVPGERVKSVRGGGELPWMGRRVDLVKLRASFPPELGRETTACSLSVPPLEDSPGVPVPERLDHARL